MHDRLKRYLERIGYHDEPRPDLPTLAALHRAHLVAIPYENLDIHCGGYLTVREADIYEKIVVNRRGGWCYEMNGLLAWALRAIGFDVKLLASTVNRRATSKTIEGNHLILQVNLDRPYLADVGFGNGLFEPIPLAAGTYRQRSLDYTLRQDSDGRWWFANHRYGGAGYDFTLDSHDLGDFAPQSHELQTWPESGFVRSTVCFRFTDRGYIGLRGAVFSAVMADGLYEQVIRDAATYRQTLADRFDLHLADPDALWEKVHARHQRWLQEQNRA